MYPNRDTLGDVPRSGYIKACDQSMVESGMTEGVTGKTQPVFFFLNEHNNTNTKPQANKKKATIFKVTSQKRNSS